MTVCSVCLCVYEDVPTSELRSGSFGENPADLLIHMSYHRTCMQTQKEEPTNEQHHTHEHALQPRKKKPPLHYFRCWETTAKADPWIPRVAMHLPRTLLTLACRSIQALQHLAAPSPGPPTPALPPPICTVNPSESPLSLIKVYMYIIVTGRYKSITPF